MKDVKAKVGSTVYLNCSSDDQSGKEIYWFHYGVGSLERQYVYIWNALQHPYDARFRMDIDPATGAYNIVIPKVEASHAGRYLCWEKQEEGEFSEAQLVVLGRYSNATLGQIKMLWR